MGSLDGSVYLFRGETRSYAAPTKDDMGYMYPYTQTAFLPRPFVGSSGSIFIGHSDFANNDLGGPEAEHTCAWLAATAGCVHEDKEVHQAVAHQCQRSCGQCVSSSICVDYVYNAGLGPTVDALPPPTAAQQAVLDTKARDRLAKLGKGKGGKRFKRPKAVAKGGGAGLVGLPLYTWTLKHVVTDKRNRETFTPTEGATVVLTRNSEDGKDLEARDARCNSKNKRAGGGRLDSVGAPARPRPHGGCIRTCR